MPDCFGDVWCEEAGSEVASVLLVVVAINRPFERVFVLDLVDRRRVLAVGVALSWHELRMLVDRRSVLDESVALSLQELRMLSSAEARG